MGELSRRAPDAADPGRRYLTLLFSDLSDSTRLAAAMEAEHYADILADVRRAYQQTIRKHGGLVVRVQGDGLLAMFGFPRAMEDDGRRAVEATLDLHAVIQGIRREVTRSTDAPLNLHSGIHSGLVLVEVGDIERGRFELLGPAPSIAARLSDAAQPQEILVSEETLGPARHFFQTGPARRLVLKGLEAPILVYPVLSRSDTATRFEARVRGGLCPSSGASWNSTSC